MNITTNPGGISYRHNGKFNGLWVDGHVDDINIVEAPTEWWKDQWKSGF